MDWVELIFFFFFVNVVVFVLISLSTCERIVRFGEIQQAEVYREVAEAAEWKVFSFLCYPLFVIRNILCFAVAFAVLTLFISPERLIYSIVCHFKAVSFLFFIIIIIASDIIRKAELFFTIYAFNSWQMLLIGFSTHPTSISPTSNKSFSQKEPKTKNRIMLEISDTHSIFTNCLVSKQILAKVKYKVTTYYVMFANNVQRTVQNSKPKAWAENRTRYDKCSMDKIGLWATHFAKHFPVKHSFPFVAKLKFESFARIMLCLITDDCWPCIMMLFGAPNFFYFVHSTSTYRNIYSTRNKASYIKQMLTCGCIWRTGTEREIEKPKERSEKPRYPLLRIVWCVFV